jgi:hypothetical protein
VRDMRIRTYLSTITARDEAGWWPAVLAVCGLLIVVSVGANGFDLRDLALPAVVVVLWLYLLLAPRR